MIHVHGTFSVNDNQEGPAGAPAVWLLLPVSCLTSVLVVLRQVVEDGCVCVRPALLVLAGCDLSVRLHLGC